MKLSKRLEALIEEHDIDEGEILLKVMLDPDSKEADMEGAIYDFMTALPDYDPAQEYKVHIFIQNNLLDDDDEDDSVDDEDDLDGDDLDDEDDDDDWDDFEDHLSDIDD